ncbi:Alpha/Beta hydrolase protein [Mycena capillaripes]|nr:Alpha/Beta hydrolase protein [Mycena capillaripes]
MDRQMRDNSKSGLELEALLPPGHPAGIPAPSRQGRSNWTVTRWLIGCTLAFGWVLYLRTWRVSEGKTDLFYANVTSPKGICPAVDGPAISHSGYIGLKGDSDAKPKRLFFWYFEAEHDAESAPIIVTIGGGPGTSGMMNPMWAQGPCLSAENGTTIPNPHRWTEHFNLLALDHPVGVGFSYGSLVNNSRDAAIDAYEFLQKFLHLFPHLSRNKFIFSGGSYGGTYLPHIATMIHEQNLALAAGKGHPGAVHVNLDSMMISNPMSDATSHFTWFLQTACHGKVDMFNASTCAEKFQNLPKCLDSIRLAEQGPVWNVERRAAAHDICWSLRDGDTHGTIGEDVRKKCFSEDPYGCLPPAFRWTKAFFTRDDVKDALGVPDHVNFTSLSEDVFNEFSKYGDTIQSAYLLYEPLLSAGIRLLHYVGAQDANCNPLGIMSFLKLLQSPFQDEFLRAPDVPWPTADSDEATVRVVGEGAGNMTWILIDGGGHFVAHDQPELVKSIVEHWVENVPFN